MKPATENPSIPPSLPADGTRGADAGNVSRRAVEHTPLGWLAGIRLQAAITSARAVVQDYAADTDTPDPRLVELADLIDAALRLAVESTPRQWGVDP